MADGATLGGIISGTDPMAPVEMQAMQQYQLGQSALDASNWANQGPFGALGRMIAAARGSPTDALQQITSARAAAMPDLAAAYNSPDPYAWAASNQNANPIARWMILQSSPEQVAQTKNIMAEAALRRAGLPVAEAKGRIAGGITPGSMAGPTPQTAPATGGATAAPPLPTPTIAGAGPLADPTAGMPQNPALRQAWYQGLTPQQKIAVRMRLAAAGQQQTAAR